MSSVGLKQLCVEVLHVSFGMGLNIHIVELCGVDSGLAINEFDEMCNHIDRWFIFICMLVFVVGVYQLLLDLFL